MNNSKSRKIKFSKLYSDPLIKKNNLEVVLSIRQKIGNELGNFKLMKLKTEEIFILISEYFYISYCGIYITLDECLNDIDSSINKTLTEIEIDSTIEINSSVNNYTDNVIKILKDEKVLYTPKILCTTSSKMPFIDIYDAVKDLNIGTCTANMKNTFYFTNRILNSYITSFRIVSLLIYDNVLETEFKDYPNSNLIIGMLGISNQNYGDIGHSNVIIIDKNKKEIERFEPSGDLPELYNGQLIDNLLKLNFNKFYPDFNYVRPLDYCPIIGPQVIIGNTLCEEGEGTCLIISSIYLYLRIRNPEYERKEIIDVISKYSIILVRKFNTYINMLS